MKTLKKLLSVSLVLVICAGFFCFEISAQNDYTIVSPYADVVWDGENAWKAYKGNLHSHSTYSDADVDLSTMVKEYYSQDYDFLANTDHGITGTDWNKKQAFLPLYSYQTLLGNKVQHLTDEEFEGITTGTYENRGSKMVCVTGGNELNNLTLTKSHVNGFFLPEGVGNGFGGFENGYEDAVAFVELHGGLSHINHPGDWLESKNNIDAVSDKKNVDYFADILLRYDSCLGMEVFNENNGVTPFDRILWDNLLMATLPYGKTVIGFSNTDAHRTRDVDTSFSVFMMKDNTVANIKKTMQSGAFFMVTRILRANDIIGPEKEIDARNTDIPYPVFTKVVTEGHKISVNAENAETIQWIADGKVIASGSLQEFGTLDLDTVEEAHEFSYVRAEIMGKGGACLTQALIIDNGTEPLSYESDSNILDKICFLLKSTRFWTIIVELFRMI